MYKRDFSYKNCHQLVMHDSFDTANTDSDFVD